MSINTNSLGAIQKGQNRLFVILGFIILMNMIQAAFTPLLDDEAYYWMWSQKLDWGYFDHPPLVALWIKIGFTIIKNELGLRLVTILTNAASIYLLFKLLSPKTKDEFQLFLLLFFSMVFMHVYGFITTPDSPLFFFIALYFYALKRFLNKTNFIHSILLGLSMAGLMYSKYHAVLVIAFSLLPLVPRLIKTGWFYFSALFALLLYAPHILWQIEQDFISFNYHIVRRNVHNHFKFSNTTDYLVICLLVPSPFLIYHLYRSVFKFRPKQGFERALLWCFWGIVLFFLFTTLKRYIQAQWIMAAIIPMFCIAYLYYRDLPNTWIWLKRLCYISIGVLIIARLFALIPDPPFKTKYHGWEEAMKEAGEKSEDLAIFNSYQAPSLFSFYNYPHKKALRLRSLEDRGSQFDLWNSHNSLDHKRATYFSTFIGAPFDSLKFVNDDPHSYSIIPIEEVNIGSEEEVVSISKMVTAQNLSLTFRLNDEIKSDLNYRLLLTSDAYEHNYDQLIEPSQLNDKSISFELATASINKNRKYAYLVVENYFLPPIKISEGIYLIEQ